MRGGEGAGPEALALWCIGGSHILTEADDVAVEVTDLELFHAIAPKLRCRDNVGAVLLEFGVERVHRIGPEISVEGGILVPAVGAAAPGGHPVEHDDLVVAPDHPEHRRVFEEIADDLEAELVAIVFRRAHDIGDEEVGGNSGNARHDRALSTSYPR